MNKKKMGHIVLLLIILSVGIYSLQIAIFHDTRNTAFYILQDFAFMPVTIAVATLVVGELINEQERRDRRRKTRMLTSTFFTEMGTRLIRIIVDASEQKEALRAIMVFRCQHEKDLKAQWERINGMQIRVCLTADSYTRSMELIKEGQMALLVLSSNSLLMEHEHFTDLLWGLFHLIDEYNLRGAYEELTEQDIRHLNDDFSEVLRLLMLNYTANAKYVRETYPNLYRTAKEKLQNTLDQEL